MPENRLIVSFVNEASAETLCCEFRASIGNCEYDVAGSATDERGFNSGIQG